jgi:type IV secretory pathway VirB6-like protein
MGSYFTISLLSTSQWTQAAIVTCTTLGWLSITYTNWTQSRWMQDIVETIIEWSSDAFKTS